MKKLLTIVITVVLALTCCFSTACIRIGVNDIKLDKTDVEMVVGEEITLTARFDPENASNQDLTWASTDKDVATVRDGKIKALSAGWTVVWVKTVDGGKVAMCTVTVTNNMPVRGVTLDQSYIHLDLENGPKIAQLNATVQPSNAYNKDVSWTTDNENVAKVDQKGNITAKGVGSTKINVITKKDGYSTSCVVVVTKGEEVEVVEPTEVTLNKTTASLTVGEKETLTATVKPSNATNKTIIWSTSDSSVATVSKGVITAVGAGTATITATTEAGNKTATCEVIVTGAQDPDPDTPGTEVVNVTGVELNKENLTITVGGSETLRATVEPSNATNKAVTWESSNSSIVKVDQNGKITAVKTGTAFITVRTVDGDYDATCRVIVETAGGPGGSEGGDVDGDLVNNIELIPDEEAGFYEGKLTIRIVKKDAEMVMLNKLIEAFNEKYPYIEVEVSSTLQDQYYNNISYDVGAGVMTDVFWISQDYIDHIVNLNNIIYPLNAIDEKDDTFSTDVLVEEAVACSSLKDASGVEQLYMIPRDHNEVVMYYNVDMLEAAGVEMPSATEPMSQEDFETLIYELRDYYGVATMPKVIDVNAGWDSFIWPLLKGFGAQIIDEQGNVKLNSEETRETLLYWRGLFEDDIVPPSSTTSSGVMFYMGQAPIYFHSRAELINIVSSDEPGAPTNIGVAPMPQFGSTYAVGGGSSGYAMYKGTKNATEAWAFLKFVASEEAQEAMGTSGSSIPSLKSLLNDPDATWRQFTHEKLSDEYFNHDSFLVASENDAYTTTREFFDYMPIGCQKRVIECITKCFQAINDNQYDDDLVFLNEQILRQHNQIELIIREANS